MYMTRLSETTSLTRRTVLKSAGAAALFTGASSTAAGDEQAQSESIDSSETRETGPKPDFDEPVKEVVAEHLDRGESFVFDSIEELQAADVPAGEYRLRIKQQTPEETVETTDHVELGDELDLAAHDVNATFVFEEIGYDPNGTVPIWISTFEENDDSTVSPVGEQEVVIELYENQDTYPPDEDAILSETAVTGDTNGQAFVEFDIDVEEEGRYYLVLNWGDGHWRGAGVSIGPFVDFSYVGTVPVGKESGVGVSRTQEGDGVPGEIEVRSWIQARKREQCRSKLTSRASAL